MKRNWMLCLTLASVLAWTLGCKENKPAEDDPQDAGMTGLQTAVLEPDPGTGYGTDYNSYETTDTPPAPAPADVSGEQTYVVQRKDTLCSIARAFYNGDASKWRAIYQANQERIADPNKIYVGMRLIIPRAQ